MKTYDIFHENNDFEVYKSNVCHFVKEKGDLGFIKSIQETNTIEEYFSENKNKEGFYLLAMADYLCRVNNLPQIERFNVYRNRKLKNLVYSRGVLLLSLLSEPEAKKRALKCAIPEFLKYNIVEENVRDVH